MKAFFLLSLVFFSSILFIIPSPTLALPLYTNNRWIVNEYGQRVKLACVNWPSHGESMVTEGLSKQPMDAISKKISSLGFNCVRLTYAIYMVANETYANVTVRESLFSNGLHETAAAIEVLNPNIIDLPLIESYKAVVRSLGRSNIMVIADNHVSKPQWCCGNTDGNGFFGDKYFDPNQWIRGLSKMATMLKESTNVVGMSLRNELRGPRQNVPDWYKYMQKGAEAVHRANPNVLVVLSGLSFDTDLSFLEQKQVDLSFKKKLVFELHWYSFSNRDGWANGDINYMCSNSSTNVMKNAGFLVGQGFPLFLSEFGISEDGKSLADNHCLSCLLALAADLDLDWALWSLPGSYYIRQGKLGMQDTYSVVAYDWVHTRNKTFIQTLSSIRFPFRGPGLHAPPYKIIYHPQTGQCVLRNHANQPAQLGSCLDSEAWSFRNKQLALKESSSCIEAYGPGHKTKLGIICGGPNSKWDVVGSSKMQFASQLGTSKKSLCLDVGSDGRTLVTKPCKCLEGSKQCDPQSQWFKLVTSTRQINNKREL